MDKFNIKIKNLKSIKDMDISFDLKKGVYAITGINGVGKSTFLNVMAKLVYRSALISYFPRDGGKDSKIVYEYKGVVNEWVKPAGQWVRKNKNEQAEELFYSGIYEASIIYGNRFVDADRKKIHLISKLSDSDLCSAPDLIINNLGEILKNDDNHYSGLKKVKSKTHAKKLGFDSEPYIIDTDSSRIHQLKMSTGEFLVIGLLDYIYKRINYNKRSANNDLSILILDEIDLALHPSAQVALIKFLNRISNEHNLCIYLSTHSVQILSAINKNNIYFLDRNNDGKVLVSNPCYPAYASRSIYEPDGYDFIILVEDELAKKIVETFIQSNKLYLVKLIKIIPCGGWEKVIELQKEINISKLAGHKCKTISILDGDIEDEYNRHYKEKTKSQNIKFLPIQSLEKHLRHELYLTVNDELVNEIGDKYFRVQSLTSILGSYRKREDSKKDNNGKGLFSVLKNCAIEQGHIEENFVNSLCEHIANNFDMSKLENALIKELS
ncbi:AAA family ATPase [Escherichia coli]|nr:AAA family ATPase [Escherichia coli]